MARDKFGPHLGSISKSEYLNDLFDHWRAKYEVKTSLPLDEENSERVRPRYCGAHHRLQRLRPLPF
ncbi:hypothetical protein N665_2186s0004 [Sinapis alba]|nr:hypothetical protein N665_2186s0004 [Sinapis alba]